MMTNLLILCAMIAVISLGALAFVKPGQIKLATVGAVTTTGAAESEREIRAILERYYEIAREGDRAALKDYSLSITAPEYRYSSELGTLDKAATALLFDQAKAEFVSAKFDDFEVQVHGETAIAKYRDWSNLRAAAVNRRQTPTRFTNVWVRRDGRWLIVAEHSSLVADPPILLPRNRIPDNLARK